MRHPVIAALLAAVSSALHSETRRHFGVGASSAAAASLVAGAPPAVATAEVPAGGPQPAVDPQVYELAVEMGALERSRPRVPPAPREPTPGRAFETRGGARAGTRCRGRR